MRILKEQSAFLLIDVQEKLFSHMAEKEHLLERMNILVEGLVTLNIPGVVTEQYRKGLGPTLPVLQEKVSHIPLLEKMSFSCCDDPPIMEKLKSLNKPFVILAGIETHVCILQTAIDLKNCGMTPVVVADAVSSRHLNDKEIALRRVIHEGGIVTTVESLLFELVRFAGTDVFKTISKLVK